MKGFVICGKMWQVLLVLRALVQLEREFPHLMGHLRGGVE